ALVAISWPWVFWFNVPLGLAGAVWAWLVLEDGSRRSADRGLDLLGTAVYVVGLTGVVFALSRGALTGWTDTLVFAGLAAGIVLTPVFLRVERRTRAPMLDLS